MVQSLLLIFKIHNDFLVLISSFSSGKIQVWCECDATKTIGAIYSAKKKIACMPISITLNQRACTRRCEIVVGLVFKKNCAPIWQSQRGSQCPKRKRLIIQVIFCQLHAWSLTLCFVGLFRGTLMKLFFFLHDSKITKIKPSIKKKNVEFSIFCDKSNFTKNQLNHYIICYINSSYIWYNFINNHIF